jgi:putative endonuclease
LNKKDVGNQNEKLAQEFLIKNGYTILDKNFLTKFGEIDIIAKKGNVLVFVEVRSKSYTYFGKPFETINKSKIQKIIKTAQIFISKNYLSEYDVRFDVISIEKEKINHIQSAFDLDYFY